VSRLEIIYTGIWKEDNKLWVNGIKKINNGFSKGNNKLWTLKMR
jgi:hypothetical protein